MTTLRQRLVDHVQEAHAMETNSLRMLDSMVKTTDDPEMRSIIEHHIEETRTHADRIQGRLREVGEDTSTVRETGGLLGAAMKGLVDRVRPEKPSRNARDGYATEHLEIAAYELLCRFADRAGDPATAEVARSNLKDERAMAEKISSSWDKVIDLTIKEEELTLG